MDAGRNCNFAGKYAKKSWKFLPAKYFTNEVISVKLKSVGAGHFHDFLAFCDWQADGQMRLYTKFVYGSSENELVTI